MKKSTCILFSFILVLSACHSKTNSDAADKDAYQQTKETLEEKEKNNPLRFLSVSSHDKHNLVGKTVIKATISNKATLCVYKDIQLELSFFSATGTLLEKDNETVYEEITPGNSIDYKTKYYAPKGTDSVGVKILGALNK